MDYIFLIGLIGSIILVIGAAWPEKRQSTLAIKTVKNWLFAVGGLFMFMYALLGYFDGAHIFFVFLETLVIISNILMMLTFRDRANSAVIAISGSILVAWSLFLFEDYTMLFFVFGLTILSLGYAFRIHTIRRMLALTIGSTLIAIFSHVQASWIFFWLNLFFAAFSCYYLLKNIQSRKERIKKSPV